jgi:putative ABC transport system permease protein
MRHAHWPHDPDRPRDPPAVRVFRAGVRLAPRAFRLRDGEALAHLFSELHSDSVARWGRAGGLLALALELPGLARVVTLAWLVDRRTPRARFIPPHRKDTMWQTLRQDIRSALRVLRAAPVATTIAVLTIALGVGANTAMFSLVHGVLLKPLAMPRPDRLMALGEATTTSPPGQYRTTSPASFLAWKESVKSASGMAGYTGRFVSLTGLGEPESIVGIPTVGGLLDVIGVHPLFGRTLLPADEDPAGERVAVLSFAFWQQYFGDDRGILGRKITINGGPVTVVGVMPRGFTFPDSRVAIWEPLRWTPEERANRDQYYLSVVARLRDGASPERFRTELDAVAQRLRSDWSQYNTNLVIRATPLQESIVRGSRQQLLLLMGAVALILLITCANLANLMLARSTGRRREIAVRSALGAASGRIVRQLLTESVLLAVLGGIAAVGVGQLLMRVFLTALRDSLPRASEVRLDGTVLLFTLAVSVAAGLAFGLAPAVQLSRGQASDALRNDVRVTTGGKAGRQALVVAQLALALMLLAGAGLLLRSFAYLGRVNPGFDPRHLLTIRLALPNGNAQLADVMLARVRPFPGVRDVALTSQVPVGGRGIGAWFNIYGRPTPVGQTPPAEAYRVVTPSFFETARIPLERGRLFTDNDGVRGTPSVIVNQALAKKYWPDRDPLGQDIYLGAPDNRLFERATIVGIVRDTREAGLTADPIPVVYAPLALMPYWRAFQLMVRTEGDPMAILPAVRREIRALDPALTLRDIRSMEDNLRDSLASNRWSLILIASFAAVAVVMAAIGVFGVLSYLVSQRTKELGIRVALGAAPERLRRMVVGQGLRLAAVGTAIGLVGAYALNGFLRTMLFGVRGTDPVTYTAVAALLVGIAVMASWIPARRSTRIDPMQALREG